MNRKAKQILQKANVDKLPSLPHVLLKLLNICHHESLSFTKLANIIRQDPALYAQFSSMCQQQLSSNYNQNSAETTLEQGLEKIGVNAIKSIAVTATVHRFFMRTNDERTDFLKQHWQHSLCCASVAESIARLCKYKQPGDAYSAGLLHDIGQLILESSYPDKYTATFAQSSEDDYSHTLEIDAFATTHQQVGAELLKTHGADSFVCDAVLYHHERLEHILDAHPLVKIIFLANALSGRYFKAEDQGIFDAAEQLLGLDKAVLLEVLEKSQEHVSNIANTLEIQIANRDIDDETAKQHRASDEFKQTQLAEQVKNIALLDGIHQHLSRSEGQQSLIHILSQHVCLLFGVKHCILFLYDAAHNKVFATSANNQPQQLTDLSIPLLAGRSLVTDALINRKITNSFVDNMNQLSIIDRQLIGICHQDGLICLPMLANNATIGTLVLSADTTQHENLKKQQALLMRFATEIAHTISVKDFSSTQPKDDCQQNEALQQKIHEVLHEVRNPLSIMNNYLGILSFKLESDKPAQEDVQTIKSEIERISDILNRLSEEKISTDETSPIDINSVISELTKVFQGSLFSDKNIQISLDLDDRIKFLQSNANALKQIYTNLIKNAVEALPANGEVMVYTQDSVNVDGQQHIEISVADNGSGIDADILPHLFSPIETKKGEEHAGLGLTIVKNLVSELHGSISCRSSAQGTSFHILLPR
jgi:putative nucleotidyltransferase with HDIG domain